MSCCNKCVPRLCVALDSSFKEKSLLTRLCKINDYAGYVRLLIEEDISSGLDQPSSKTVQAVKNLIRDLDDALGLFKGPVGASSGQTTTSSNRAQNWGLNLISNCRLITILVRQCYSSNDQSNFTLANLVQTPVVNYSFASERTFIEFLCCLCENLRTFTDFLGNYVSA